MSRARKKIAAPAGGSFMKSAATGIGIGLVAFIISSILLTFVTWGGLRNFLQSDQVRRIVAAETSEALKSRVEISPIAWENNTAWTDQYTATGFEDAPFRKLELNGFRAHVDLTRENFRRRVWDIEEVKVNQLSVVFSDDGRLTGEWEPEVAEEAAAAPPAPATVPPLADEPAPTPVPLLAPEPVHAPAPAPFPPVRQEPVEVEPEKPGFFSNMLPNEVEIGQIVIQNTNLYFEGEQNVRATGMETLILPTSGEDTWKVRVRGGVVQVEDSPERELKVPRLEIDHVDFTTNWERYYITDAQVQLPNHAVMTLDGELNFEGEGNMQLQSRITNLESKDVLSENWKHRLKGSLTMDATVTGSPHDMPNSRQQGTITLHNAVIEALPVLEELAKYTKSDRFRRLALNEARTEFTRQGDSLVLQNIALQSDGLARLEGNLVIQGDQLAGKLQMGVVPGTLKWIPGAERNVFTENRDGYLWTEINVGGTVQEPRQDLAARLQQSAIDTTIESIMEGDTSELENAAKALLGDDQAAEKIIGVLKGLFK